MLERAKLVRATKCERVAYVAEHAELAIAWARGEITVVQAVSVLGKNNMASAYNALLMSLRHAIRTGRLVDGKK